MGRLDPVTPTSPTRPLPRRLPPPEPEEQRERRQRDAPRQNPDAITDDDGVHREDDAPSVDDYA